MKLPTTELKLPQSGPLDSNPVASRVPGAIQGGPDAPSGSNASRDFHGEKRTNATHQSTADPECRLYKKAKGTAAQLSYLGHVMMENRNGLAVDARVTEANGTAERDAAMGMAKKLPGDHRKTLGADKNYDTKDFAKVMGALKVMRIFRCIASSVIPHRSCPADCQKTGANIKLARDPAAGWHF